MKKYILGSRDHRWQLLPATKQQRCRLILRLLQAI